MKGVEKLWEGPDILSNHYATSVITMAFLFGLHGRTDPGLETPTLRCVDLKTGSVRWKKDLMAATIYPRRGRSLILTERGELIRAAGIARRLQSESASANPLESGAIAPGRSLTGGFTQEAKIRSSA